MKDEKPFGKPSRIKSCFKKVQFNPSPQKNSRSVLLPRLRNDSQLEKIRLKTEPNQEIYIQESLIKESTKKLPVFYPKLNNHMHMKRIQEQMKSLEMIEKRYQKKSKHLVTYESVNNRQESNRTSDDRRVKVFLKKKKPLVKNDGQKSQNCLTNDNGYVTFKPFKAFSDRKEMSKKLQNND